MDESFWDVGCLWDVHPWKCWGKKLITMICFEKAGFCLIEAFTSGDFPGFFGWCCCHFPRIIKISTPRVSRSTLQPELTSLPFDLNDFLSFICRIGRLRMQVFKFNSDRFFPPWYLTPRTWKTTKKKKQVRAAGFRTYPIKDNNLFFPRLLSINGINLTTTTTTLTLKKETQLPKN